MTPTAEERARRDAARYRGRVARFLGVPVEGVSGEVVERYRSAMVRRYGGAPGEIETDDTGDHRAGE